MLHTKELLRPLKRLYKHSLIALLLSFHALGSEESKVKSFINQFKQQQDIPGLAAAIIEDGKVTFFFEGWANEKKKFPVTKDTLFEIGSITKVFTTDCLALELLKGTLELDTPAVNFIPEMQGHPHLPFSKITVKQLATHTASLPSLPPSFTKHNKHKPYVLDFLKSWKPPYPLGTRYEYSNLSFGILGWVLAGIHHRSYYEVIQQEILRPLKMEHTFIDVPNTQFSHYALGHYENNTLAPHMGPTPLGGGGALRSTLGDLTLFLLCNMGIQGPLPLIKACKLAQQPLVKVNDFMSMGLGWQNVHRNGAFIIDKNGATTGFSSYIGFLPEKNMGVVLLANKSRPNVGILGRKILFYLNHKQPIEQ